MEKLSPLQRKKRNFFTLQIASDPNTKPGGWCYKVAITNEVWVAVAMRRTAATENSIYAARNPWPHPSPWHHRHETGEGVICALAHLCRQSCGTGKRMRKIKLPSSTLHPDNKAARTRTYRWMPVSGGRVVLELYEGFLKKQISPSKANDDCVFTHKN